MYSVLKMDIIDKAGKDYWNNSWSENQISDTINPRRMGLNNYVNKCFHKYFHQVFSGMEMNGVKLLEIGCARSAWLPYFAKEFGFKVTGLDYSEIGCQQAMQILSNEGVQGEVICADFSRPPKSMLEGFDVVVSFGVIEHFQDTVACIDAFSKFLKPNGIMITNIPNMVGLIGLIEKFMNRHVFEMHLLLDRDSLRGAHEISGLEVLDCNYFIFTNFSVCNLNGITSSSIEWHLKKIFLVILVRFSMIIWLVEDRVGSFKPNKVTSAYINCTAHKPLSTISSEKLYDESSNGSFK